jgi:DNA-binding MarR family transcriptional regulator
MAVKSIICGNSSSMGEYEVEAFKRSFVHVLIGLRTDRMESWSEKLHGLTRSDLNILIEVENNPDISLKEIRDKLDIPNSTLTYFVDRLETMGLVQRVICSRDRRSFNLKLTTKGRGIREEHDRVLGLMAARILECLDSDEERRAVVDLLLKIAERIDNVEVKE